VLHIKEVPHASHQGAPTSITLRRSQTGKTWSSRAVKGAVLHVSMTCQQFRSVSYCPEWGKSGSPDDVTEAFSDDCPSHRSIWGSQNKPSSA